MKHRTIRSLIAGGTLAALATVGLAGPASANIGSETDYGWDGERLTVTIAVQNNVYLKPGVVSFDIIATATGSGSVDLDPNNWVSIESSAGYEYEMVDLMPVTATKQVATVVLPDDSSTGEWYVHTRVSGDVDRDWVFVDEDYTASFWVKPVGAPIVKAKSTTTLNVTPEPVKNGGPVTAKGKVTGGDVYGRIVPLKGVTVLVYFNPAGDTKPTKYMGAATTDSGGWFSKGFRQYGNGQWIAKYKGTSTRLPSQGTDVVAVTS